ncbi:aminotransferase class I/II-fold pyridoxal phosphate-dependent enzyme [Staphylococcus lutrae]|uniref:8-amino-7-oxononanoate synthase n=1 Tax=Staphylococcus lutrae TaxID=155085 RepID=A0AAC9RVW7_9STAP|nr:pyridoxal phosphate-dependent aminotransferase family protein [Staphylococcus lutrae]ARJ50797.1 8-amino-7-oxononanoate synthase [Staphylococcus lutrae]PNZ34008.1 8-amino-7-oxononanoate synthase [Staphylococcus lutrae]
MDLQRKLQDIEAQGIRRQLREVTAVNGKWIEIEGRQLLNFTSNDYLGMGQIPLSIESMRDASDPSSSRLVSGNVTHYRQIEQTLAEHFQFEDALVMNSGYDANLAVMQAFQGEEVILMSDAANHASLIDGIRLSRLNKVIYPHQDIQTLEKRLRQYPESMTKVIVTDSVFSTHGDMAQLEALIALKAKIPNVWLLVDDSHAFGLNLHTAYAHIDILTTSLSKGVGAHGGAILCSHLFKQVLVNTARVLIYSNALPIIDLVRMDEKLKRVFTHAERSNALRQLSLTFNQLYQQYFGNPYQIQDLTPIKAITFDSYDKAEKVYQSLESEGYYVSYFRYPTVPKPALRVSLSWFHEVQDLKQFFVVLQRAMERSLDNV